VNKFRYQNFQVLERTPTCPAALEHCLNDLLYNSTTCRARVEMVNPTTGEYRIVLQGTLDCWEETKTTQTPYNQ